MTETISERMARIFEHVRPVREDETDGVPRGDALLKQDEVLWQAVQQARDARAREEAAQREARELMDALEEAAQASGLPYQAIRDRLENPGRFEAARKALADKPVTAGDRRIAYHEEAARRAEADGDTANANVHRHHAERIRREIAAEEAEGKAIEAAVAARYATAEEPDSE